MRLYLLPISTRRTLIYAQRLNVSISDKQTFLDKQTARAAKLWASWEKKESGWQKKIVELGNKALRRVPFEEWGLKSIPPLSQRRKDDELSGKKEEQVEVSFPPSLIPETEVLEVLKTLGTERESLHKQRMIYCFIGMPISAPFALIPIVPNLPFFYLVYRAFSHWRALSGSKHIQFLLQNNLTVTRPSQILDKLYSAGSSKLTNDNTVVGAKPAVASSLPSNTNSSSSTEPLDTLVLDHEKANLITEALEIPELHAEFDRAIWQVETSLKVSKELREEKEKLDKVAPTARVDADGKRKQEEK